MRLTNRTTDRAEALAQELAGPAPIEVVPWAERAAGLEGAGLLVNSTQLGMQGQAPLELSLEALPVAALVTDAVYAPLETELLAAARGDYPLPYAFRALPGPAR